MGVLSFSISIALITVALSVSISTLVGAFSERAGGMVDESICVPSTCYSHFWKSSWCWK